MEKLRHVADLFNRDSLIEKFSSIKTSLNGVKGKVVKKVGTAAAIGVTAMMLAGCPQPNGPVISSTPQEPETPRIVVAEPTTAPETEPVAAPENEPETEPTNGADATNGDNGTSNRGSDATITPDPLEPEDPLESDPIEPDPPFDPSKCTPQSHTPFDDNSPYELHCFGDIKNVSIYHDALVDYNLDQAKNYFKGKAQQIESNTADRPAIRAYFQDLIDTLNSVDQYNTFGDITIAVNEMAGRYMADLLRPLKSSGDYALGCTYDAIKKAYGILAIENDKSGYSDYFVGGGDYDYRISKENFMQELAETNPHRNSYFKYYNVKIEEEYTNGFQGTRTVLEDATNYCVDAMNGEQRFNNQLTLPDEQAVYDVALATHASKSAAIMFNSGSDMAIMTEECQMQGAYNGWTYTPHIEQQNGNEQGL